MAKDKKEKIELLKRALLNEEGWNALALSIKNAQNPADALIKAKDMLNEIVDKRTGDSSKGLMFKKYLHDNLENRLTLLDALNYNG